MNAKQAFEKDGFVVLRGLLSTDEAQFYRKEIQKLSKLGDADFNKAHFECPDGVTKHREFWPLIFNPRLLSTLREVLGPTIRYTQHSDIHAHRIGGWHRDCACRKYGSGPDWQPVHSPYHVVRVAIYLQTYAESGSSLGLIPGSHRPQKTLPQRATRAWTRWRNLKHRLGLNGTDPNPSKPFPWIQTTDFGLPGLGWPTWPVWVRTEPGDTIIFDQRCYHSASEIRGPKYAVYLSYSPDDEHAANHLCYYRQLRPDLNYGEPVSELVDKLKKADLYFEPEFTEEQKSVLRQHCHIPATAGAY